MIVSLVLSRVGPLCYSHRVWTACGKSAVCCIDWTAYRPSYVDVRAAEFIDMRCKIQTAKRYGTARAKHVMLGDGLGDVYVRASAT